MFRSLNIYLVGNIIIKLNTKEEKLFCKKYANALKGILIQEDLHFMLHHFLLH